MNIQDLAEAVKRRMPRTVGFFEAWLGRFFEIEGVERSIALASQAFTALFPALIVYASVVPQADGEDFADNLIERLHLTGASATSVRTAFAPPDEVTSSVTFVSVLFVLVAALAFTRAFQRTYERSWRLDKLGVRGTKFGLAWLAAMAVVYSARPVVGVQIGRPLIDETITIATSAALWLMTPYLLLSRRLPWRRLVPSALLAALMASALGIASLYYVPGSVESSAERFGVIGVAFALLGWLVASGFAVTIAATGGAVLTEEIERHSRGKLAAYVALERVQAAGGEGGEEDGAEHALHGGEGRPGKDEEHRE